MPRTAYYERSKNLEAARLKVIKRRRWEGTNAVRARERSSILGHSDVKGHCEIAVA